MHYDKKTGLAIAVLLCGAVAAFFFRKDTISKDDIPKLKDVEYVDREIEGENTPYLDPATLPGTIEEPISSDKEHSNVASHSNNREWNIPFPDFLDPNKKNKIASSSNSPIKRQRIGQNLTVKNSGLQTPTPIKIDTKKFGRTAETIPKHNNEWKTVSRSPHTNKETISRSRESKTVYTIRSGDTLSGLASRFLGSSGRYLEIYRANRDVIDNPDHLRPGTEIRIPEQRQKRTKTLPVSSDWKSSHKKPAPNNVTRSEQSPTQRKAARENKPTTLDLYPKLIPAKRRVYFRTPRWRKTKF